MEEFSSGSEVLKGSKNANDSPTLDSSSDTGSLSASNKINQTPIMIPVTERLLPIGTNLRLDSKLNDIL